MDDQIRLLRKLICVRSHGCVRWFLWEKSGPEKSPGFALHLLGIQNIQEDEDYDPDFRDVVYDDQDAPEYLEIDTELMIEARVKINEAGHCRLFSRCQEYG